MISPTEFAESMRANGYVMGERGWVKMKTAQQHNAEICGTVFVGQPDTTIIDSANAAMPKPPKRIRQSSKPLMNKLEAEFYQVLCLRQREGSIRVQAIKFELARGIWYKPDFVLLTDKQAYEVKGPHAFRGGFENLKVAARCYPEMTWLLVWKSNGQWQEQKVLP